MSIPGNLLTTAMAVMLHNDVAKIIRLHALIRSVLRYLSPVSGRMTTILVPSFSGL
jgi:hypothetical protein